MTHATGLMMNFVILGLLVFAVGFLVIDQYVLEPQLRLGAGPATRSSPISSPSGVRRFEIDLNTTETLSEFGQYAHLALTPDGSTLLYAAKVDGVDRLFSRPLNGIEATPIRDTEGANFPCVSPDGLSAAFFSHSTDRRLKSVRLVGELVQNLVPGIDFAGGCSFMNDNEIVFSIRDERLLRIPVDGGESEVVYSADPGAYASIRMDVLPGGAGILFSSRPIGGAGRDGNVHVWVRATGEVRTLVESGYFGRYAASGHVIFVRNGDLWAVPFDVERLERSGDEVTVLEGVHHSSGIGVAAFDVADDGTLVYVPGGDDSEDPPRRLVWVDRQGQRDQIDVDPLPYWEGSLSPDGTRWATARYGQGGASEIYVIDLERGTSSPVTRESGNDQTAPLWTPDGQHIVFRSWTGGMRAPGLYVTAADGVGEPRLLYEGPWVAPSAFTPDGRSVIFEVSEISDLLEVAMDGSGSVVTLFDSAADEDRAAISPNGEWIAYTSNEAGDYGVYVQAYPELGQRHTISNSGAEPLWSRDGRELFYRDGDAMMVVDVEYDPTFLPSSARQLFTGNYYGPAIDCCRSYGIHPDGQRFLMIKEEEQTASASEERGARAILVQNWFAELNELAPPSNGE